MADSSTVRSVIVAGFGPVGRAVAQGLEQARLSVTIVELNAKTVETQSKLGKHIVQGDIADPEVLERAGIGGADALILTVPDEQASLKACTEARKVSPRIFIAVRSNHLSGAMTMKSAGADHVTIEEIITAESMQQAVLARLVENG